MDAGINTKLERRNDTLEFDTRHLGERLKDALASPEVACMSMALFALSVWMVNALAEPIALAGILFFFYTRNVQKKAGLALRVPKSSGDIDPQEIDPGTRKPAPAEGIFYLGNVEETGEEIWLTDNQARTHMLFMGTTGSGKTEYLISLVFNALIHGSGLIYVDGKADSSLYGKIYAMARSMGRDDDVLVINFQTGAKDIYGAQPNKLSNTLNPFAVGSSGMLSELVKGLMASGTKDVWTQQAESFVEALMKPLVYLRDHHGLNLDVNVIRDFFELNKLEELAWVYPEKYPKLGESGALAGLHTYLMNKPGYKKDKYHDQSDTTHEQHGFITMQLIRTFSSLSDTYGYIMKTPLAEIDFVDVFINRRILVVLLPALEKSPTELTNLGRIVVASIKATMAKGLGSAIEGEWAKVIDSKPTYSPSPFPAVLDEYGYYAVEGFAVVPAQARSLGFSAIFAGQDLPAFEKASKEEAKSTLANTNTKFCGKLECVDTFNYFKSLGGQGLYTRITRYETDTGSLSPMGNFKADNNVNVERMDRVQLEGLRGQLSGQWNMFYGNTMLRVKSFFAAPKKVKHLRVNHFIKVARPDAEEIAAYKGSMDTFKRAVGMEGGMLSFMDVAGSVADIKDVSDAWKMFSTTAPLLRAGMALAHGAQAEERRVTEFTKFTNATFTTEEVPVEALDVVGQMGAADDGWGLPQHASWEGAQAAPQALAPAVPDPMSDPNDWGTPDPFQPTVAPSGYGDASPVHAVPEPEGLYDGVPSDVGGPRPFDDAGDSGPGYQFDAEPDDGRDAPFPADDVLPPENNTTEYGDEFEAPSLRGPERASLIPSDKSAEFNESMNLFGFDSGDVPPSISQADNDMDAHAADLPSDLAAVEEPEDEFDAPLADSGMLNRDATLSGLEAIERLTGATPEEAQMTAAIVVEDLRDATQYSVAPPTKPADMAKFAATAEKMSALLSLNMGDDD